MKLKIQLEESGGAADLILNRSDLGDDNINKDRDKQTGYLYIWKNKKFYHLIDVIIVKKLVVRVEKRGK